ncbi:MAG: Holliday junction resolvase RuvX, partial [Candidatus Aminicenantes bacterium]
MKLLAIDFGMKRMGFAIGNTAINTAAPIDPLTHKNTTRAIEHIKHLIAEYDITRILIGYPLNMNGSKSKITGQVEHFTARLKKNLAPDIATEFVDERLSSFEAEQELKTLQPNYKKR